MLSRHKAQSFVLVNIKSIHRKHRKAYLFQINMFDGGGLLERGP